MYKKQPHIRGAVCILSNIITWLDDQQGITITEEPVFILDRFFVGFHGQFITGKGTGHDQQAGFWQMKIRYQ